MNYDQRDCRSYIEKWSKIYRRFLSRSSLLVLLLFVVGYLALASSIFTTMYRTNDDIAILDDIKAGFRVNFMSCILGNILSFCYAKVSNSVPWYGIFCYVSLGAALFILLRSLFTRWSARRLIVSIAVVVLYTQFVQKIGYNTVAVITGGVGVLGLFVAFHRDKVHWYTAIGYGMLLGLAFLWRVHVALFIGIFLFPLLAMKMRKYWFYCALFVLPCILLYVCNAFVGYFQETPEQKHYDEFNRYRGQFHGTSIERLSAENYSLLRDIGWTENDFYIYKRWFYVDEEKYNIETAKQLIRHPSNTRLWHSSDALARDIASAGKRLIDDYHDWILIIAYGLLLMLYYKQGRILLSFAFVGYVMVAAVSLGVLIRFPLQIGEPMFLTVTCFLAFILVEESTTRVRSHHVRWGKLWKTVAITGLILLVSQEIRLLVYRERLHRDNRKIMYDITETLESIGTDSIFLIQAGSSAFDAPAYRSILKVRKERLTIIPTGWPIFSPRFYATIRKIGLKRGSDIFPYLVNLEKAFVVCRKGMRMHLSIFIKETYGIEVEFDRVAALPQFANRKETVCVYRVVEEI